MAAHVGQRWATAILGGFWASMVLPIMPNGGDVGAYAIVAAITMVAAVIALLLRPQNANKKGHQFKAAPRKLKRVLRALPVVGSLNHKVVFDRSCPQCGPSGPLRLLPVHPGIDSAGQRDFAALCADMDVFGFGKD